MSHAARDPRGERLRFAEPHDPCKRAYPAAAPVDQHGHLQPCAVRKAQYERAADTAIEGARHVRTRAPRHAPYRACHHDDGEPFQALQHQVLMAGPRELRARTRSTRTSGSREGSVNPAQAASAPRQPARCRPMRKPTWLLVGPGSNWHSATISANSSAVEPAAALHVVALEISQVRDGAAEGAATQLQGGQQHRPGRPCGPAQLPRLRSAALPPVAVVFTVSVRSFANRAR